MKADPTDLSLRPCSLADQPFLLRVYASTRADEMEQVPWTAEEKANFLGFQFDAQHRYYREHFPKAAYDLILLREEPVGRLYVDRREEEIRLIDIALLPRWRGSGLGSMLLGELLTEAREADKLVRIHVEANNPAMRLYLRLGFAKIEEQGVYHLMEWRP